MYPFPPPRVWAPQVSICAFAAGVFTGGGGLKNQLKKFAIGLGTTCFVSDNAGSETNARVAVAISQPEVAHLRSVLSDLQCYVQAQQSAASFFFFCNRRDSLGLH